MPAMSDPGAAAKPVGAQEFTVDGACDTHVHVFGPQNRFAYVPDRRYTPDDAVIEQYQSVMNALGLHRAVLTQPSVYGLDNSALLHAIATGGAGFRGVVMVDAQVEDTTLARLHEQGVRAVRTQLKPESAKPLSVEQLRAVAHRIAPLGWHVEIHLDVAKIEDIDRQVADFPVPVVIEHMGHMPTKYGVDAPGFQALLRLLRDGGWVKLSGSYINSGEPAPHEDVRPFVDALLAAAPERAVWGTNWPHPHQPVIPDDRMLARSITHWIEEERLLRAVLATNPARLYDFD